MYNKNTFWVRIVALVLAGMMIVGIISGVLYSIF